jgi:hypothetical protein
MAYADEEEDEEDQEEDRGSGVQNKHQMRSAKFMQMHAPQREGSGNHNVPAATTLSELDPPSMFSGPIFAAQH